MANKLLRVALVGTGRWGSIIAKTLGTLPECRLAYQATREWRSLLEKTDIDGIIIATPPSTHTEIALAFIEHGIPVYIEKPLAVSAVDAQKILDAAQASGAPVFVGHIHLYNPAYQETKKLSNTIGALKVLVGEGANMGPYREDYSAMWDYGSHDIYMMLDLVGEMPESVQAWGTAVLRPGTALWDIAQIKLNFKNAAVGYILSSSVMPQKRRHLTVVGETGSIVFDDTLLEKKVMLRADNGDISHPAYEPGMPLTLELQAFLNTIKTGAKPNATAAEGLAVVRVLETAEKSIAASGIATKITT